MEFETRSKLPAELSLTPLIDVVFLLLVFFMLTSSMVKIKTIDLDLPDSNSADQLPDKPINISLNKDLKLYLDDLEISREALKQKVTNLTEANTDQNILLSVDSTVPSQEMITVMDIIRNSGGTKLSIATE